MSDFYILDVFAERKYAGNQLAVIVGTDRETSEMQDLAREMAFSETTFVGERTDDAYPVRIFTPAVELDFAGHPTIGTAYAIRVALGGPADAVTLELKAGNVPVEFDEDGVGWMSPPIPTVGARRDPEAVAKLLGVEARDIASAFPVVDMTVGVAFTMIPMSSLDAVKRASWNPHYLSAIRDPGERRGVFIFCAGGQEAGNHIHARMLAEDYGVVEDPATGSANTCLAHYIREHAFVAHDEVVRVEQGYEIERPSLLRLRIGSADIAVGGKSIITASGTLR